MDNGEDPWTGDDFEEMNQAYCRIIYGADFKPSKGPVCYDMNDDIPF